MGVVKYEPPEFLVDEASILRNKLRESEAMRSELVLRLAERDETIQYVQHQRGILWSWLHSEREKVTELITRCNKLDDEVNELRARQGSVSGVLP